MNVRFPQIHLSYVAPAHHVINSPDRPGLKLNMILAWNSFIDRISTFLTTESSFLHFSYVQIVGFRLFVRSGTAQFSGVTGFPHENAGGNCAVCITQGRALRILRSALCCFVLYKCPFISLLPGGWMAWSFLPFPSLQWCRSIGPPPPEASSGGRFPGPSRREPGPSRRECCCIFYSFLLLPAQSPLQ